MNAVLSEKEFSEMLVKIRELAKKYKNATGRSLGVTGEIAEAEAKRILKLELKSFLNSGYDAIFDGKNVEIKGRVCPEKYSGRISTLNIKR